MKIIKVYKSLSAFLFYITLIAIIAGINFSDGRSPGWFVQTLPINDAYNDLFFIDSLHGWMVSTGYPGTSDTGYIIHTYNGGYNWIVQKREPQLFWRVQFLDTNYGYVVGGNTLATIQKTTNGGLNWTDITGGMSNRFGINDISFANRDTGWICINDFFDGGVYRTVNGGGSWGLQQFDQHAYKVFFINKDTGWYSTNEFSGKLYRTINGGGNWSLQYTVGSYAIEEIFFINGSKGWMYADYKKYTTDGGYTWTNSQGSSGGNPIKFINENIGYAGSYSGPPARINKSTDGGKHWGYQITPYLSGNLLSIIKNDTMKVWASDLIHTTDGGGPIIFTDIQNIGSTIANSFKLYQNYPNPFNATSIIKYKIEKPSFIKIAIFNTVGKEILNLINIKQTPGIYEVKFNAENFSSGIYFYSLFSNGIMVDTKKAVLLK